MVDLKSLYRNAVLLEEMAIECTICLSFYSNHSQWFCPILLFMTIGSLYHEAHLMYFTHET